MTQEKFYVVTKAHGLDGPYPTAEAAREAWPVVRQNDTPTEGNGFGVYGVSVVSTAHLQSRATQLLSRLRAARIAMINAEAALLKDPPDTSLALRDLQDVLSDLSNWSGGTEPSSNDGETK